MFSKRWIASAAAAALAVLLVAGGLFYWNKASAPTTPPLSLVVLPFQSVSHEPDQEAFADALTADLTNASGHIRKSFVISNSTALTYKGKPVDVRQIGRELGVRYVLEGTIQKLGDSVRVDAQLINAETGGQIWADQFNGDIARLADLHDEVKQRIARSLNATLVAEEGRRAERRPDNRDAVGLTFQARAIFARGLSKQGLAEARKLLDQALDISPDYPEALVGRADADAAEVLFFRSAIPLDKAEQLVERAMELEPGNVYAKGVAALLYLAKGDYERAAFYSEQIIAIDPSNPYAYAILAPSRWREGRAEEAIALEEKAIRLSPHDPSLDLWYRDLGMTYLLLGRDAEAVPWLEKAVQANDKVYFYHLYLAAAYALTGRLGAARKEVEATLRLYPGNTIAKVVALEQQLGSTEETYRKQFDHVIEGLRRAGMPEN